MKKLFAFDLVILVYMAAISAILLAARPGGAWIYLAYHGLVLVLMALVIGAHARFGGRLWTFARYWYVVPVVLASFRELHYLIPEVRPFDGYRFDRALAALDLRLFGDVDRFFLGLAWPPLVDLLHVFYWFYFPSVLIPGVVLHLRGEYGRLREYVGVVLTAMYLSYLGYVLVPAVGPHHFYGSRPAALDGWLVGGAFHHALLAIEWNMPDAFPSGHALVEMVVLVLAWRLQRPTFWAMLVPCVGCIAATMALRYHYVVDVAAAAALLPVSVFVGAWLHRRREEGPAAAPLRLRANPNQDL